MSKKKNKKDVGYVKINDKIRIKVETDCLTIEESVGESSWGNSKYFTSWGGVLNWLVRRFSTEKLSKKKLWVFADAKKEILRAIKEVEQILLGGIEEKLKSASSEIKKTISKY